jgi:hypothetical protein
MAKISSKGVSPQISERILKFLNNAKDVHEIDSIGDLIAGNYDIGELVVQLILDKRDALGGFTDLSQLSDIRGFGIDKFNDLVAVFVSTTDLPIEGVYEPLFRFASLRYHVVTKVASKSADRKGSATDLGTESKARRLSKTELTELERAHVSSLAKEDIQFIKVLSEKLENLATEYYSSKQKENEAAVKKHNELIQRNLMEYEKSLTKEEKKIFDEKKQTENSLDAINPSSLFPSFEFDHVAFASTEFFKDKLTPRELSFLRQNNLLNLETIALKRGLNDIINEKRNLASHANLQWKKKVAVSGTPVVLKNRYSNGFGLSFDKKNALLHLSLITAQAKSFFTKADITIAVNSKIFKSSNVKLIDNSTCKLFLESSFDKLTELDIAPSFTFEIAIELNSKERIVIKETVSSHNDIWVGQYSADSQGTEALRTGPGTPINKLPGILRLGWADLMRVEQKLCCYLPGEVSHIENIMAREYKEKSTEYLERSENTIIQENETETIEKNDTTSVEKNDWNKEISKTIENNFNFGLGTAVSYSAGPWSMSINANMSIANSQTQASTNAQSYSKEITESASESIRVRSFEKRTTTLIKQFKEENKHGFDNRLGDQHVSGVFRWIDKIYKNRIVNYGRGMLYEFMVPKPSELYVETLTAIDALAPPPKAPVAPDINSWQDVTRDNFMTYINGFKVTSYQLPLPDIETDRFTTGEIDEEFDWFHINQSSATRNYTFPAALASNYDLREVANSSFYKFEYHNPGGVASHFKIDLRNSSTTRLLASTSNYSGWNGIKQANMSLTNLSFSNQLEVFIYGTLVKKIVACDLDFVYKLKSSVYQQWQQATFTAIMDAYQTQLDAYNAALALQQSVISNEEEDSPLKNPGQYQTIINTELKRLCIELLLQDTSLDRCQEFYETTQCSPSDECEEIPTLTNLDKLDSYSSMVKFLEQSFNWSLSSYNLYDYYWGGKCDWADMLHNEDTPDNEFQKFLKSGMARVLVPVREGFEKVVAYYLATGQPWFNGEPPVVDDPLYVSIVAELSKPTGTPVGVPWNTNVPSSLTLIQADTVYLQNQGLPCCKDVNGGGSGISPSKNKLEAKDEGGE